MRSWSTMLKGWWRCQSGSTPIDYAVLVSAIALGVIPAVEKVGHELVVVFTKVQHGLR
jgi:Flp pilus assembly pilin Flp